MKFWFSVKEGMKGFRRARLSSFITFSSLALSLFLLSVFILLAQNVGKWAEEIRGKAEIEAFLKPATSPARAAAVQNEIRQIKGVQKSEYISKEIAARRFKQEFGRDIYQIYGSNPLPTSIRITFKKDYRNDVKIEGIIAQIKKIRFVDDVAYEAGLLALLDKYLMLVYIVGFAFLLILFIVTVTMLHNTIRLTIFARKDIIEIMKLVGATKKFIKRPFIIEGILQGAIGAIAAGLLLYGLIEAVKTYLYPSVFYSVYIFYGIFFTGIVLGYLSSRSSVLKYLDMF